jgi:hypothetical protein
MQCVTHGGTCAFQFEGCKPDAPLPPGEHCTWQTPAGWRLGHPCPVCGHSDLVHIGTDHCPVCELVYQATPQFCGQQEQRQGGWQPLGRGWRRWPQPGAP